MEHAARFLIFSKYNAWFLNSRSFRVLISRRRATPFLNSGEYAGPPEIRETRGRQEANSGGARRGPEIQEDTWNFLRNPTIRQLCTAPPHKLRADPGRRVCIDAGGPDLARCIASRVLYVRMRIVGLRPMVGALILTP